MDPITIQRLTQLLRAEADLYHNLMEPLTLQPGEVLFRRGDPGESMYLIESGSIRIYTQDSTGEEITINHILAGGCLGELALLDAQPRSASAMATEPTKLLCLARDVFLAQVSRSRPLNDCVLQLLSERVRYMTEYVERMGFWARLLARGDYTTISASLEATDFRDDAVLRSVSQSIREMVDSVRQREEELQNNLKQLQIEIDQDQRQKQVDEITETDFFQSLVSKARDRRQSRVNRPKSTDPEE